MAKKKATGKAAAVPAAPINVAFAESSQQDGTAAAAAAADNGRGGSFSYYKELAFTIAVLSLWGENLTTLPGLLAAQVSLFCLLGTFWVNRALMVDSSKYANLIILYKAAISIAPVYLFHQALGFKAEQSYFSYRFSWKEVFAYSSVLLYMIFVELVPLLRPLQTLIRQLELVHNVGMSLLSLAMLVGITRSIIASKKFDSFHSFACRRFREDEIFLLTVDTFFYSKFWEWIDTGLLISKGKKVSWLHYTHHASTAFITGMNMVPRYSAMWSIVCLTNSFVHTWMYGYYAYPGSLRWSRKLLTKAQIAQHLGVITTAWYVLYEAYWRRRGEGAGEQAGEAEECYNALAPIVIGQSVYIMYMLFFVIFYVHKYIKSEAAPPPPPIAAAEKRIAAKDE